MKTLSLAQYENLKREAKRLKKVEGIKHMEALDRLAQREGFRDWNDLQVRQRDT